MGAAGNFVLRNPKDSAQVFPTQITFGAAYTTNGQFLFYVPFRAYSVKGRIITYGEAGYYRYVYNYFGVGNEVPPDYFEKYKTRYSRLRLNVLYKINKHIYAGPRFWLEDHRILKRAEGGLLEKSGITGAGGARVTGLGLSVNIDSRDRLFFPEKGIFAELAWQEFNPAWGNSAKWRRWLADISVYRKLLWNTILALNGIVDCQTGETPFMLLAGLGGGKRMRGYYENRFRDNNAALAQLEFRKMLSSRLGFTVFASGGKVFNDLSHFGPAPYRFAGGGGIRISINKSERLNLRLDAAVGKNSHAFYILVGEAF